MYSTNDIFRTIEDDLLICNKFERWHLNLFILFSFHICLIWDLGHICRINPIWNGLSAKNWFLYRWTEAKNSVPLFCNAVVCVSPNQKNLHRDWEKKNQCLLKNLKVLICLPLLLTISTLIKELLWDECMYINKSNFRMWYLSDASLWKIQSFKSCIDCV